MLTPAERILPVSISDATSASSSPLLSGQEGQKAERVR